MAALATVGIRWKTLPTEIKENILSWALLEAFELEDADEEDATIESLASTSFTTYQLLKCSLQQALKQMPPDLVELQTKRDLLEARIRENDVLQPIIASMMGGNQAPFGDILDKVKNFAFKYSMALRNMIDEWGNLRKAEGRTHAREDHLEELIGRMDQMVRWRKAYASRRTADGSRITRAHQAGSRWDTLPPFLRRRILNYAFVISIERSADDQCFLRAVTRIIGISYTLSQELRRPILQVLQDWDTCVVLLDNHKAALREQIIKLTEVSDLKPRLNDLDSVDEMFELLREAGEGSGDLLKLEWQKLIAQKAMYFYKRKATKQLLDLIEHLVT